MAVAGCPVPMVVTMRGSNRFYFSLNTYQEGGTKLLWFTPSDINEVFTYVWKNIRGALKTIFIQVAY